MMIYLTLKWRILGGEIHTKIGCVQRIKVRIAPMLRRAVDSKEDVPKETFNYDWCVCT
jgi:hypothetical protein